MKFYPNNNVESQDLHNITWSPAAGAYILSNGGKNRGIMVANLEEFLQIKTGNFQSLKDTKFYDRSTFEFGGHLKDANLTNVREVSMHINEKINDNQLPFGVFKLSMTDYGITFIPFSTSIKSHNIIDNKNLKDMVKNFFNEGVEGRKNKKGFLLYGPPGNGKTTEVMSLFSLAEEMQIRIFIVDAGLNLGYIDGAQKLLEKDRNIFIMEEITERTEGRQIEHLLTFLDGESSWDNTVVIATTNYPEDLPSNLVDRPGRFDTFIEYGNPSETEINLLGEKFNLSLDDIKVLHKREFSFDYVSYIMSEAKNKGLTVSKVVEIETEKKRKISATFKAKIGIY